MSDQGGSVLLCQYREHVLLGPALMTRVNEGLKMRGESHWCFPQFGSAPSGDKWAIWPRHGCLRWLNMSTGCVAPGVVRSQGLIQTMRPAWECLVQTVGAVDASGEQAPGRLLVKLKVENRSDTAAPPMPILPAWHPYFNIDDGAELTLGDVRVALDGATIGPVVIRREGPITLKRVIGTLTLETSPDCEYVVVWSDQLSVYVCVDPVFGARPGTLDTAEGRYLANRESTECWACVQFQPA